MKKKLIKFVRHYLLVKDVFNVLQWVVAVWFGTVVLQLVFGQINAPAMSMSYLTKAFMAVSAFSLYFVAAWMMLRIFFSDVAAYFMSKTEEPEMTEGHPRSPLHNTALKTKFRCDIERIRDSEVTSESYKRLIFHFSVYFFLVLAIIFSGPTLF